MKKRFLTVAVLTIATFCSATYALAETTTFDSSLGGPGFYNGSGNPDQNFTIVTQGNLQLGLEASLRFVGPIDPGNSSNYIAPTGTAGGDALWDVPFSVNTQSGGGTGVLGNFSYTLQFLDTTTSNSGPIFDPSTAIPDDSYQGSTGKTVGIGTKNATDFGFQNAENFSFEGFLPGFDPNATDTYEAILTAYDPDRTGLSPRIPLRSMPRRPSREPGSCS